MAIRLTQDERAIDERESTLTLDPGATIAAFVSAPILVAQDASEQLDRLRYRPLLEALGVAVYTTDAAGRIAFFNGAAADLWGRRPDLGEEWCGSWRLFWPDGRSMRHQDCPMAVALKENRPVRGALAVAERPDGSRVSFVPYPTPLRNDRGELIGAVNVLVDVSERVRAEEELKTLADALRTSNAVKDEFLGMVSHELRTPVTTIFGNARLLHERSGRLTDEQKQAMVADIADDSERLLGIIENLLLLTRLESGGQSDLEPQVLGHVVRKSVDSFLRRHRSRQINLRSPRRHLIIEGDRTDLEIVIENLLSNADKYSARGSEIDVVVQRRGGEALVLVRDRGVGISDARDGRLFTAFYRATEAKTLASGLGLGLAVCKRVVEKAGGRIWAQSRRGGGTEVGFAVPILRMAGNGHEPAND